MSTQTLDAGARPQSISDIKVYWKPGCSNCIRLKEYVSKRGFDFEAVDLMAQPERMVELTSRGLNGIPVITNGEKFAFGLDLDAVDKVLGLAADTSDKLSAKDLLERMVHVVDVAMALGAQLPEARYDDPLPGRAERSYLGLVNHVTCHINRFAATTTGKFDWTDVRNYEIAGDQPVNLDPLIPGVTFADIEKRAREYQEMAREWLEKGGDPKAPVPMFYGDKDMYHVLESNAYSVVQHTRQLQAVITFLGFKPAMSLTEADLTGLRLPTALWDEVE